MNKQLAILLSIVFIDLLGFGIVIPLFPLLVESIGGGPVMIGVLIGVYSLFQFLFSPILGRLSDKYGRKPVLFVSAILTALGYLVVFFSHSFWILLLGRVLSGIGSANISVVQAYIADTSEAHERTKRIALLGSIFGLGFIFGPVVGGLTASEFNINTPFLLTAVFSAVNAILILFLLPESNKALQKHIKIELLNIKVIREVMRPANMSFLIFLFFLVSLALALIIGVLPLFSQERFGWNERANGYYFMAIGIASFVTQAFLIRLMLKRWNESQLIKTGMVLFGISGIGMGLALNPALLVISGALSAVGFSMLSANLQALISLESKPEEQGMVMGVAQSFSAFGRVLGPIMGGGIASVHLNLPYYFSGLAMLGVLAWGSKKLSFVSGKTRKG